VNTDAETETRIVTYLVDIVNGNTTEMTAEFVSSKRYAAWRHSGCSGA